MSLNRALRAFLLASAMFCLLAAMWAGLLRLGVRLPVPLLLLPTLHGPLMVAGFLGTLVSLERAVALGRWWTYLAPVLSAAGTLGALAGIPGRLPVAILTAGSAVLVVVFVEIIRRQPALFNGVMALGALCLLAGNALWLVHRPFFESAWWWSGFLILTIVGERLELSRLLRLTRPVVAGFALCVLLLSAGLVLTLFRFGAGVRLAGLGMAAFALWLLTCDIARRTVKQRGITRFVAVCLLVGYAWLGLAGILAMIFGGITAGPLYDAALHAIFLGFVFSMIFGHAPIIFPAVLGIPIPFRRMFYLHLAVLHGALLARVAGDLAGLAPLRQWGGTFTVAAILLFMLNTVLAAVGGVGEKRLERD